ncbi:MAG TPA: 4-(cytidine 5'-diphospho)-2-C-methyl-D-erythritol kinase [Bacteroidales bacterium]|nr:4-(cytidine 5'-diphospho)-2-C-methyl-D-erythritol kinase [Bacteroidales bacterium]
MIVFPNAKINVGLRITARRNDGYHDIETIFYPVGVFDALEFIASDSLISDELVTTGNNGGLENIDQNLVIKALSRLRELRSFPWLKIHLHKAIPLGAGLGGGSSDASCILKSVNKFFSLNIPHGEIMQIAASIGSDCSFFIDNVPAFATGRGEILSPSGQFLKGYFIVLLNPGLHVSTKEAYGNCKPATHPVSLSTIISMPVNEWKDNIKNDFEDYAFAKYPLIGQLKEDMYRYGALFSLMSGSGSSVFGIFKDRPSLPERIKKHIIFEGRV